MPIVPKWGPYALWPALVIKTHTHTYTHKPVVMPASVGECVHVWGCHTLLWTVCVHESLLCMSAYEWLYVSVCVCGPVCGPVCICVSVRVCVAAAAVGCSGWNVCLSAGPVRPLLLNICPLHINSPTLTHPSLPRDHLIEIHNDSFFFSLPHWVKWGWNTHSGQKWRFLSEIIFSSCLIMVWHFQSTTEHLDLVGNISPVNKVKLLDWGWQRVVFTFTFRSEGIRALIVIGYLFYLRERKYLWG